MKVLNEGSLHNLVFVLILCIVFAQLGVIARTNNKFVEISAVAELYLIITHVAVANVASSNNYAAGGTSIN